VRAGGGLCGGYRHLYAPITAGNAEHVNRSCAAAWTSSCATLMSMQASALRGKSERRATSKVQRDEQRRCCGKPGSDGFVFVCLSKVLRAAS